MEQGRKNDKKLDEFLVSIGTLTPEERKMISELRNTGEWSKMKMSEFKRTVKRFYTHKKAKK